MARTTTYENETHWKTSDVQRIVRAAVAEAGTSPKRQRIVRIKWQVKGSRVSYRVTGANPSTGETTVDVFLPRKGPKLLHHNALVALAAAGIDTDTPMLAVSDSYFIANALAYEFAKEATRLGEVDDNAKVQSLAPQKRSTDPPSWFDATKLVITKYADPGKDGTYVAFKEKKEAEIEAADVLIEKHQATIKKTQSLLNRAKRKKKAAQTAVAAAKKRRLQSNS
jgi:hypothetical protein